MHTYFVWRLYWEWNLFFLFIIRKHDLDLHCLHLSKSRGTGSLRDVRNAKEPRRGGSNVNLRLGTNKSRTCALWQDQSFCDRDSSKVINNTAKILEKSKKVVWSLALILLCFLWSRYATPKLEYIWLFFLPVARRVNMTFNLKDFKIIKPDVSESY